MSQITRFVDDLDGTEVDESEVKRGVTITIGTHKGKKPLDLKPEMYDALIALSDGDPTLVRGVFTPEPVETGRHVRTPEEMEAIRVAARAAKNPDGTPMFETVKDKGRQPEVVYTWYYTEFLPSQQAAQESPTKA